MYEGAQMGNRLRHQDHYSRPRVILVTTYLTEVVDWGNAFFPP